MHQRQPSETSKHDDDHTTSCSADRTGIGLCELKCCSRAHRAEGTDSTEQDAQIFLLLADNRNSLQRRSHISISSCGSLGASSAHVEGLVHSAVMRFVKLLGHVSSSGRQGLIKTILAFQLRGFIGFVHGKSR